MNKLRYFRNVLFIAIPAFVAWGWLVQKYTPGSYDSIAIRSPLAIIGVAILAGSYFFEFIRKNIEVLLYAWGFTIFGVYIYWCSLDPEALKLSHYGGLWGIGGIITVSIISRRFLYAWTVAACLFSLAEAIHTYGNGIMFLFWLNLLTVVGTMSYFSLQRIRSIERIERAHAEDKRKSDEIRGLYEMASQAAHDIRSPVTALEMVSRRLGENAPERELLKGTVQRINSIAENMLAVHRRGQVGPVDGKKPTSIRKVLEDLAAERRLRHPSIKFNVNVSGDLSSCGALGASELYRIISNLHNNSIEAGATSVELIAIVDGSAVRVLVRDNGRGIAPEVQQKLFSRGFSFGKQAGNGLGLYGARQILESVGGDIALTSQPGTGTEIKISFPSKTST